MTQASKKSSAGKMEATTRSDCYIEVEIRARGGIELHVESKVLSLYGAQVRALLEDVCAVLGVHDAVVRTVDQGALPYTLAARLEPAIKRALPEVTAEFLPVSAVPPGVRAKDRPRRTRLYLPGNEPKFFVNAGLHKPDAVVLDLEDSVASREKDAARILVRNALRCVNFYGAERMVRINEGTLGVDDLRAIVPQNPDVIVVPKCEDPGDLQLIEEEIQTVERSHRITPGILLLPIIETARGVVRAHEIAAASQRICALSFGLQDYAADIGVEPTAEGKESLFARSAVVNAARAAHVQALDSVFVDVDDLGGLRRSTVEAKSLGFEGKGCIHPRQIRAVHEALAPTAQEIARARQVIAAAGEAEKSGLGVLTVDSKMIDAPVVARAERILMLADRSENPGAKAPRRKNP